MNHYRERLVPPVTVFVASALLLPATLLVFLPINPTVGVVMAVLFYAAAVLALVFGSPVLTIDDEGSRRAGPASTPTRSVRSPRTVAQPPQRKEGPCSMLEPGPSSEVG
nr:hypothetical protein GCM10025699_52160 [Microbacterium flavescens]